MLVAVLRPARTMALRLLVLVMAAVLIATGAGPALADPTGPASRTSVSSDPNADADVDSDEEAPPALLAPGSVSGVVRLVSGGSAAGVLVQAIEVDSFSLGGEVVVGASGAFELELEAGSYMLFAAPAVGTNAREHEVGPLVVGGQNPAVSGLQLDLPLDAVVAGGVSIVGQPRVASTLTASTPDWLPSSASFAFQWYRDGEAIIDATERRYTVKPDDAGYHLQVEVAGMSSGLIATTAISDTAAVALGSLPTGPATISGTARVGTVLTVSTTVPDGAAPSYEWQRNGSRISGATGRSYRLQPADSGQQIRVVVRLERAGYADAERRSSSVKVAAGALVSATPRVSGTSRVGSTLTAVTGSWTDGTQFRYQWRVDGRDVSGATGRTFTPRASDVGKQVSVRVTGSLPGYSTASKSSGSTGKVARASFSSKPTPRISGSVRVGQTLRASAGSWGSGVTIRYQWRIDGKPVSGATRSTFKVRASDHGKRVTVTVTASRAGFTTASTTSAKTGAVAKPFSRTSAPTISGTVRVGSTLTARPNAWAPSPSFSYQWYANGKPISGATRSTFKLTPNQFGTTITVKVTGKRSTYVTASRTSKATGKVVAPPPALRSDGIYRVGRDIRPGTYAASNVDSCYWERRSNAGTSFGGIIANDFVPSGRVIVTISASDRYFSTSRCGAWTRLMPSGPQATRIADGTHAVGIHVRPGTYRVTAPRSCYWERTRNFGGRLEAIIDNEFTSSRSQQIVRIRAGEGFTTRGCGTWTRTGS